MGEAGRRVARLGAGPTVLGSQRPALLPSLLWALAGIAPCAGLPLEPQTSWTYRARVAWTTPGTSVVRRRIITWTTIIETVQTSDSVTVATVRDWPTGLAWWTPGQASEISVILCRADRLYHLSAADASPAAVADSLLAGRRAPSLDELILQLPLHTGDLFGRDQGDRDDTFYAWYVDSVAPAAKGDSVFTLTYRTVPDHQRVRFVPGLGITEYAYMHHGTVAEVDATLIAFRRPRTRSADTSRARRPLR